MRALLLLAALFGLSSAVESDVDGLHSRFEAIKAKIGHDAELAHDPKVRATLARISSKFEKMSDLERDEKPKMSMERKLHDRFDAIKAKIGRSSELKGDAKIAAAVKSIGSKFDRLASMEREEEKEEDEEDEVDEVDEEEDRDMERALHDRFEKISSKIARSPELKHDAKVMGAVKRINAKFDRLAANGKASADFERETKASSPRVRPATKSMRSAKRPSIFKKPVTRVSAMASKRTSQKAMQPEKVVEADEGEDGPEEDLEALASRFSAIQKKINEDKSLRADPKIQETLKRISSKFERSLERDAEEEPDLERLESRFEAIKSKINAQPDLKGDKKVQASLKRISAKFDDA